MLQGVQLQGTWLQGTRLQGTWVLYKDVCAGGIGYATWWATSVVDKAL